MRGLKLFMGVIICFDNVASFTDAWIETLEDIVGLQKTLVASFTDAWIETHKGKRNATK